MRAWRALMLLGALAWAGGAAAAAQVMFCFNYGCQTQASATYSEADLTAIGAQLAQARSAREERAVLARVIGRLYREAGQQLPMGADRKGNFADQGVLGRMDCIDHSTSTMRLLQLLEARGMLHFHKVAPKARRTTLLLFQHFSAVVEELSPGPAAPPAPAPVPDHVPVLMALCDCGDLRAKLPVAPQVASVPAAGSPGARYVVDSWFVEQGEPAVILPLADWLDGDGPYVP
ncbi:hypothetical protein G3580_12190 [Nitrogeniibacter mangrovi]|uniref:Uncharacterized protein n=1 Tax=Nitrogeniibacter mangrovi TaxID=2016596 RepID=A0A6C1B6I7_9RHOO|nr:hypothetical protein [Nitrogeniibacter mangrovi]QID18328.1 hypothetical protein G3580_12190 [Nitrogeniibacter mangrovi]